MRLLHNCNFKLTSILCGNRLKSKCSFLGQINILLHIVPIAMTNDFFTNELIFFTVYCQFYALYSLHVVSIILLCIFEL